MAGKNITLRTANPIASKMWDKRWNEMIRPGINPDNVQADSANVAWFRCMDNPEHIFKTKIKDMTDRRTGENCGCIFCGPHARRKFVPAVHPLSDEIKDIEDVWSPMNKNGYTEYETDSIEKVRWICRKCGGSFYESIKEYVQTLKTCGKVACPYCSNSRPLVGYNTLETVFDDIESRWSEHNKRSYQECTITSLYTATWICPKCGKEFDKNVAAYIKGIERNEKEALCPECAYADRIERKGSPGDKIENIDEVWDGSNEKNYNEYPADSFDTVMWKCPDCGGRFSMMIAYYILQLDIGRVPCPYCSGKEPLAGFNTIETVLPYAAEVWSDENEKSYTNYLPDSDEYAKWVCRKCHGTFKSPIDLYIRDAESGINRCPYCLNLEPKAGFNTLEMYIDDIDEVWSPKNMLSYTHYIFNCDMSALFICKKCHGTYSYAVNRYVSERRKGLETCPYCQNKSVLAGYNSLDTVITNIDDVWAASNKMSYSRFPVTSYILADWNCMKCGSVFKKKISKYIQNVKDEKENCPYCSGNKVLAGYNSLDTVLDNIDDIWSSKNDQDYTEFTIFSAQKAIWKCPKCGGDFRRKIRDYIRNFETNTENCPYCSGNKVLAGYNSLDTVLDNIDDIWSSKNDRSYTDFSPSSFESVEWKCPVCAGTFKQKIRSYVTQVENGNNPCPYCNGKRALAGFNSLETVIDDLDDVWDKSNEKSYTEVLLSSSYNAYWKCRTCNGVYQKKVSDYVKAVKEEKSICPYCNNKKPLAGLNTIEDVKPDWLDEWSYRDNYLLCGPDELMPNSMRKVWWKCKKCGYLYKMSPKVRAMFEFRHKKICPRCKGLRHRKHYI